MNKVCLIGRIANDIELKHTENGKSVLGFNLAVDRGYGEDKSTDFISCVIWVEYAVSMSKNLVKGKQIGVEGNLKPYVYEDKNGTTHYPTNVVVERITFVGKKEPTGI